jgi:DNA-binding transcriptional ArsR family regulator
VTAAAAPRAPYHPDLADLGLVTVLHALSDPVRLEIVQALAGGAERPCSDLHGVGGITVATLSHHLRVLREAGLTRTRVSGKHRFLALRLSELEQRFPGVITAVLRAGAGLSVQPAPGGQPR